MGLVDTLGPIGLFFCVDSRADITIMGGVLFKRVVAAAKLKKSNLKKVDKTPKAYACGTCPFWLTSNYRC